MTRFTETILQESLTREQIDAEAGVVRRVRILGRESENGRRYSDQALTDAARLYEGQRVNFDHPDRRDPTAERSFSEFFGVLENVVLDLNNGAVFGDLNYLKTHHSAASFAEAAQRFPRSFGLSHNAEGELKRDRGTAVVESVSRVHGVDIVTRPATNKGLFESEQTDMTKTEPDKKPRTIKQILEAAPEKTRLRKTLQEMVDGGAVTDEMPVEAAPAEASPEDQIKAGIVAAIMAKLDSASDEELGKVLDVFGLENSLTAAMGGKGGGDAPSAEETNESKRIAKLERQIVLTEAKNMLLESDREATQERVAAVAAVPEGQRQKLVESWPKVSESQRPGKPATSGRKDTTTNLSESRKRFEQRAERARKRLEKV